MSDISASKMERQLAPQIEANGKQVFPITMEERSLGNTYLAIDPATISGIATILDGKVAYWTYKLPPKKAKQTKCFWQGMKWSMYNSYITKLVNNFSPIYVAAESPTGQRHAAKLHQQSLITIIQLVCHKHNIPFVMFTPKQIKAHAGHGNYNKPQMIAAAQALGYSPTDDNQADAIFILSLLIDTCMQSIIAV